MSIRFSLICDFLRSLVATRARTSAFLLLALLLSACRPLQSPASSTAGAELSSPEAAVATQTRSLSLLATPVPFVPVVTPTNTASSLAEQAVAALVNQRPMPVRLIIAAARMDVPVQPMAWETVRVNDVRTTRWVLPEDAAGWNVESARAGEAGNMIVVGRQLDGGVFAPIAQSAVQVGQEIALYDSTGALYRYRIDEISAPLAIAGDAQADAQVAAYLAATSDATLTLITGWPDFTSTHRIFVRATLTN